MKNRKGLVILLAIVAFALVSLAFGIFGADGAPDEPGGIMPNSSIAKIERTFGFGSENAHPKLKNDYVAVLHIEGVISPSNSTYNQKWLMRTIDNLRDDKKNCGILLFVDSPGGTVYEADEAYLKLLEYKEETGRPVYAYFASLAASGGYYIACAADTIFANRNTLTGSIGVICGSSVDATGMLEKIGVKSTTFTAGRNKNMLNYNSPLTDEQRDIMQSVADEAYEQFTGIVAESRGMDIADVRELADGRIYTARQAMENGLIDDVLGLEDAKTAIEDEIDLDGTFEDFRYEYEKTFFQSLMNTLSLISNPTALLDEAQTRGRAMRLSYMTR